MTNQVLINQNTHAPTRKVKAGIIAGKLVTVAFGLIAIANPDIFDRIPPGFELAVGGLITTLVQDVAAYFTKEKV